MDLELDHGSKEHLTDSWNYEATLSQHIGGENHDADDLDHNDFSDMPMDIIPDINEGDYNEAEEFILDDSMEDLIDDGSVSEQIEPMS